MASVADDNILQVWQVAYEQIKEVWTQKLFNLTLIFLTFL
jgi:hypothetical protein